MSDLTWTPDGEELFKKIMEAVPEAMRDMAKPMLLGMLEKRAAGKAVDAEIVKQMVEKDLPEPQKSGIMEALGMKKGAQAPKQPPAQPQQPPAQGSSALTWSGKSKPMFEIMLGEVPEAMRDVFRGKLMGVISQKAQGNPVTEDHVTAVVNEIVPEPFKSTILKKFKEVGDFDIKIIDEIIDRHGTSRDNLMFILHDIQDHIGFLPIEALQAVSNKCDVHLSAIYNVVTFYKSFKLYKPGTHHIKLCTGTACHLKDTGELTSEIEQKVAGATDVTMEKTLCLGCCDCAPVVEVDGKVYKGDDAKAKINSVLS